MIIQPSTKDCYTRYSYPDENTNNQYDLVVSGYLTAVKRRTYIGFNITNKPSTINNATLWIYQHNTNGSANRTHEIRRTTSAWNETDPTWNNPPSVTNTNMTTKSVSSGVKWVGYDVKNMLVAESSSVLGMEIRDANEGSGSRLDTLYRPREASTISHRPKLLINGYYVKTTGDDALTGDSWAAAWATVNKAATTVLDGSTVHIGFGNYLSEPGANKIAPQNAGTSGIEYLCETAGSSGGVGTVKIEKNP